MKHIWIFPTGVLCFALVLGLMVGASESPVAGVAISSIFGSAVALAGVLMDRNATAAQRFTAIGKGLLCVSVGLVGGILCGVKFKNRDMTSAADKALLWTPATRPTTTYEAIDWILTNELLIGRGFSREHVLDLYSIRLNERADTSRASTSLFGANDGYNKSEPYYKMLIDGYDPRIFRGVASSGLDGLTKPS